MLFNASNARNARKLHQRAADGTPTAAVSLNVTWRLGVFPVPVKMAVFFCFE